MPQKILLLTKNYPPQIGGIEKYSFDLYNQLVKEGNIVKLIVAWPRNEFLLTKKWTDSSPMQLLWKLCYIFSEFYRLGWFALRCMTIGWYHSYLSDIVWSLDGSISFISFFLGEMTGVKTRITVHGTDIVWDRKIYQSVIPKIIAKMDEIYVISENSRLECFKRWIPASKITLVTHTLDTITFTDPGEFDIGVFLKNLWIENSGDKIILFSIGRWIERKWFHWFLQRVMSVIDSQKFYYILAWFWSFEWVYRKIINQHNLNNVSIVGKVDELTKAKLFISSDYFVMPNLHIQNDLEGFGLVLLEAQFYWLDIISNNIDGLWSRLSDKDYLISNNRPDTWINLLQELYKLKI